jgi:hypothetical protein
MLSVGQCAICGSDWNDRVISKYDLWKMFRKLDNDKQRWEWVVRYKDHDFEVVLDTDYTCVAIDDENDIVEFFDMCIGWNEGLVVLLEEIGVKCRLT